MNIGSLKFLLVVAVFLAGCQTTPKDVILSQKSPVELRAIQGRVFDTTDRGKTLRTVIATLQDLGYGIEKVEAAAGTVTGRKLDALQMTVTVFPRGERQMVVRANAVVTTEAASSQVDAPQFYQQYFFEPLSKAMFLTANQDDGGDLRTIPKPQEPASQPTEKPKEAKK
jgi:predicted RNA-binding protein with EMAP domain